MVNSLPTVPPVADAHNSLLPRDVQTVLFSATFPPEVLQFASLFAPDANEITLQRTELTVKGIKQMYLDVSEDSDKYDALMKFYGLMTIASSIIFVRVSTPHLPRSHPTFTDSFLPTSVVIQPPSSLHA